MGSFIADVTRGKKKVPEEGKKKKKKKDTKKSINHPSLRSFDGVGREEGGKVSLHQTISAKLRKAGGKLERTRLGGKKYEKCRDHERRRKRDEKASELPVLSEWSLLSKPKREKDDERRSNLRETVRPAATIIAI